MRNVWILVALFLSGCGNNCSWYAVTHMVSATMAGDIRVETPEKRTMYLALRKAECTAQKKKLSKYKGVKFP